MARKLPKKSSWEARMERADFKWREASFLMLKHGYTSQQVLSVALGLSEITVRAAVRKWVAAGMVRKIDLPMMFSKKTLLMLTKGGAEQAKELHQLDRVYQTSSSKIARTLIDHTLAIQMAAAHYDKDRGRAGLHSYHVYEAEKPLKYGVRPDLILQKTEDTETVLFEVELVVKSPERLAKKVEGIALTLQESSGRAFWVCANNQVRSALKRASEAHWDAQEAKPMVGNMVFTVPNWATPQQ